LTPIGIGLFVALSGFAGLLTCLVRPTGFPLMSREISPAQE
jgi:hypothetical protein